MAFDIVVREIPTMLTVAVKDVPSKQDSTSCSTLKVEKVEHSKSSCHNFTTNITVEQDPLFSFKKLVVTLSFY